MEQNKTSRYFKYAIGEIILVVIGILIALQINNWNEELKNKKTEAQYLKNLKQDFENQALEIEKQIAYEKNILGFSKTILDRYNDTNELIIDSTIITAANGISDRRTFNTINPTYIELINTGNMKLLRNPELKNAMIAYYQEIERITEVVKLNNTSFIDNELAPQIRQLFPMPAYFKNSESIDSLKYLGGISKYNLKTLSEVTIKEFKDKSVLMGFMNLVTSRYDYAWFDIMIMHDQKKATLELIERIDN